MKTIVFKNENGLLSIGFCLSDAAVEETAEKMAGGREYKIMASRELPPDREFMPAWELGDAITINIQKAKLIGHDKRRKARELEFEPYDDAIAKQIPNVKDVAEEKRIQIRAKYADIQEKIDSASSVEEIKQALNI